MHEFEITSPCVLSLTLWQLLWRFDFWPSVPYTGGMKVASKFQSYFAHLLCVSPRLNTIYCSGYAAT